MTQALADAGSRAGAAECHATVAGLICAGGPLQNDWMAQITGGEGRPGECHEVLRAVHHDVAADLAGDSLEFDLLLPDDDAPLSQRAEALAIWCRGFLFGLTLGGFKAGRALPGDVGEVVSDFSRVSEARHTGEATDDDERDYAELCEFVRVGAQLVYEECAAQNNTS